MAHTSSRTKRIQHPRSHPRFPLKPLPSNRFPSASRRAPPLPSPGASHGSRTTSLRHSVNRTRYRSSLPFRSQTRRSACSRLRSAKSRCAFLASRRLFATLRTNHVCGRSEWCRHTKRLESRTFVVCDEVLGEGRSLGEINRRRGAVWRRCVTGGNHAAGWNRHSVSFRRCRLSLSRGTTTHF